MNATLVPRVFSQFSDPFPVVGDFVQRFRAPALPSLIPNPAAPKLPEGTNVLIKNRMPAPATKPNYGMVAPARF